LRRQTHIAAFVLLLSACGVDGLEAQTGTSRPQAGFQIFMGQDPFSIPAYAFDIPQRRAGLWEIKMAYEGRYMPSSRVRHCVDQRADKLLNATLAGTRPELCSKQDIQKSDANMFIDSVCRMLASSAIISSRAIVTGDFNEAYGMEIAMTTEYPLIPGIPSGAQLDMKVDARRLGDCEEGQKPGDVINSHYIFNVLDLKSRPAPPR